MTRNDLPEGLRNRIRDTIESYETVLFMKGSAALPQCGFSARVVEVLKRCGVEFHHVDVLADPEVRDGIKVYNDWPTIPQLFHKGRFIGGCDIVTEMFESGELQKELGVPSSAR
jgi:monothiol glutaredoxin